MNKIEDIASQNDFGERMAALSMDQRAELIDELAVLVAGIHFSEDAGTDCIWLDGCELAVGPADDDRFFPCELYLDNSQVQRLGDYWAPTEAKRAESIRAELRAYFIEGAAK